MLKLNDLGNGLRFLFAKFPPISHRDGSGGLVLAPSEVMRPPSSRVIYGDRVASLLAEGVCGYDKSRLYCACAKHVDVANAGKANTSDTNGTSSQFHIAFISLPLRKKGCVHNGRPGYINAATSRKGYYPMSAFGGKADINGRQSDVCF